jgi:hypothetical protein
MALMQGFDDRSHSPNFMVASNLLEGNRSHDDFL